MSCCKREPSHKQLVRKRWAGVSMATYRFLDSSCGEQQLIVEEYIFRYDKRNAKDPSVRYWRCLGRDEHSCRATATTDGNHLMNSSPVEMNVPHAQRIHEALTSRYSAFLHVSLAKVNPCNSLYVCPCLLISQEVYPYAFPLYVPYPSSVFCFCHFI